MRSKGFFFLRSMVFVFTPLVICMPRDIQHLKEYQKQWYRKNIEHCREKSKQWDLANAERCKATTRAWRETNREKIKEYRRLYYQKRKAAGNPIKCSLTKEEARNICLKKKYGISLDDYNHMLSAQKECCALCGRHKNDFKRSLHVDHCHTTKKVRGLLCANCNTAIGKFKEDFALLDKAKEYLTKHRN